jgi:hypothetical protein
MGYCSRECAAYTDCIEGDTYGDCVELVLGEDIYALCVSYCNGGQSDCDVYGFPSTCGYAVAIDGVPFDICADWPPEGTTCDDDWDCSLGVVGTERVCSFEACTLGCYASSDCPIGEECSSDGGTLGLCL